jgi:hypothetical protein
VRIVTWDSNIHAHHEDYSEPLDVVCPYATVNDTRSMILQKARKRMFHMLEILCRPASRKCQCNQRSDENTKICHFVSYATRSARSAHSS